MRLLFLADTHLGFDWPLRPRIERRRRGAEFLENLDRALAAAVPGHVHAVLHGGDVFFRSRVAPAVVEAVVRRLAAVVARGVPVVVVPGNHERGRLPGPLLWAASGVEVLSAPRTVVLTAGGMRLAVGGFPWSGRTVREGFAGLVEQSGLRAAAADARVLLLHEAVEGATVGPADFVFRGGPDVIPGRALPGFVAAVLAGHIHRQQVLTRDLAGAALPTPVLYPGSVARTAFAERDETKGYLLLDVEPDGTGRGRLCASRFVALPSRPMVDLTLAVGDATLPALRERLAALSPDAIVRVTLPASTAAGITARALRSVAPPTMNVSLRRPDAAPEEDDGAQV